jgi:hypothetical protein
MGTIVSFRVGQNDVDILAQYFQPLFEGEDLLRVPNYNTIVRTLINGVPTQSFSMMTMPTLGQPNPQLAIALKQLSAAKYGHPKAEVEKAIFSRLETKEPAKPSLDGASSSFAQSQTQFGAQSRPTMPAQPKSSSSFLDEWLKKKKAPGSSTSLPKAPINNPLQPTQQPDNVQSQANPNNQSINSSQDQSEGEFKIPKHTPAPSDVENTIFIDPSGNLTDNPQK